MNPMARVDVLRAACCVAGVDGEVTDAEKIVLEKLAGEVGVGKASLEAMIARGLADPDFHKEQFRVLKADPQVTMAALLEVAMADREFREEEQGVLKALSVKIGVADDVYTQLVSKVTQMMGNG